MQQTLILLAIAPILTPSLLAQTWTEDLLSTRAGFRAHASADFTGDGLVDVVVAGRGPDSSSSTLFLYEAETPGTFRRAVEAVLSVPRVDDLLAPDVDGDGDADLVTYRQPAGAVTVCLNEGDGTFAPPMLLASLGGASVNRELPLRVADGDGDGDLDLYFAVVAATANEGVWWLEQIAPGQFASAALLLPAGEAVVTFDVGDLDNDGDADVVAAGATVRGYVWYRNDGAGVLTGPLVIEQDPVFGFPRGLRAVDVTGDGRLDVVGSAGSDRRTVVYFRNLGAGAFATQGGVAQLARPLRSISIGDLDGLLLPDLVFEEDAGRAQAVSVGFGALFSPIFTVFPDMARSIDLDLADIDGDGALDAISSSVVNGIGEYDAVRFASNRGAAGSGVSFAPPTAIELFGFHAEAAKVADLNGDGAPDIVLASSAGDPLVYYENGGDASFPRLVKIPTSMTRTHALTQADLDGDGDVDLVLSDLNLSLFQSALWMYENLGAGAAWSERQLASNIGYRGETKAIDFDEDGDLDLLLPSSAGGVAQLSVVENLGQGNFAPIRTLTTLSPMSFAIHTEVGDVDGDGRVDVVVGGGAGGSPGVDALLLWVRGGPAGTFGAPMIIDQAPVPGSGLTIRQGFADFEVRDFDADGDDDIVSILNFFGLGMSKLLYYEASAGGLSVPVILEDGPQLLEISAVDSLNSDGDGDLDLVVAVGPGTAFNASLVTYENLGGGAFGAAIPITSAVRGVTQMATADVDLDGDEDIVATRGAPGSYMALYASDRFGSIGSSYCADAVPNSTGSVGGISMLGTASITANTARLRAWNLPRNAAGYFLASRMPGVSSSVPNSVGVLCLGGAIGRYVGSGQVGNSGSTGTLALDVDVFALPTPTVNIAATVGETWYFQAWTRDSVGGVATSNFTEAIAVTWQ